MERYALTQSQAEDRETTSSEEEAAALSQMGILHCPKCQAAIALYNALPPAIMQSVLEDIEADGEWLPQE